MEQGRESGLTHPAEPGCATTQATVRSKIVVIPSDFLFEN